MPYYSRRRRYSKRRAPSYYSGLARYKRKRYMRKKRNYFSMRKAKTSQEQILSRGNRNTRTLYRASLPTVIPDRGYVNLEVTGTTPDTYQPLVGDNYVEQVPVMINRIYNVFDAPAGSFGIAVQGYDQWAQFYKLYRVEAITFKVRAVMPSAASGNTVQLMFNPRGATEDPIDPSTESMAFVASRDKVRSIIVTTDDSAHTLTYQTSVEVMTGTPLGQDPGYEVSFDLDDDPDYLRVMDVIIYNILEDGNFDPIKLEYQFQYHCRMTEKRNLDLSESIVQDMKPGAKYVPIKGRPARVYQSDAGARDEMMSAASSTISGFSQLMAARSVSSKSRR